MIRRPPFSVKDDIGSVMDALRGKIGV